MIRTGPGLVRTCPGLVGLNVAHVRPGPELDKSLPVLGMFGRPGIQIFFSTGDRKIERFSVFCLLDEP